MDNKSAKNMWGDYLDKHLEDAFHEAPKTLCFWDNQADADVTAKEIRSGAQTSAVLPLLVLQDKKMDLPRVGDFLVVTNWEDQAQCIVRVLGMKLVPFFNIDNRIQKEHKEKYWNYFARELQRIGRTPGQSMIAVWISFEKVFSY